MIALQILKITGIVLLCILLFIILLLLIILFAPIHYRAEGSIKGKDYLVKVKANWLLHIIRFLFFKDNKDSSKSLKVLWIELMSEDDGEKKRKKKKPGKKVKKSKGHPEESKRNATEEPVRDTDTDRDDATGDNDADIAHSAEEIDDELDTGTDKTGSEDKTEAFSVNKDEIHESFDPSDSDEPDTDEPAWDEPYFDETFSDDYDPDAGKSLFDKIRCKITSLYDKIMKMKTKISRILFMMDDERDKEAVRELLLRTGQLLKHILPRRSRISLKLGLGDPAATGEATGLIYAFWPIYRGHLIYEPDFDEKVVEGEFYCKGHILLGVVLIVLARVYFNKDIRRLYRQIQKIRT